MFLDILKEQYKNTFIEPRLSGRQVPEKFLKDLIEKIDSSNTIDEFLNAVDEVGSYQYENVAKHILLRIVAWENEPPFNLQNK